MILPPEFPQLGGKNLRALRFARQVKTYSHVKPSIPDQGRLEPVEIVRSSHDQEAVHLPVLIDRLHQLRNQRVILPATAARIRTMPLLLLSTADGVDLVKKEHDWAVRSGRLKDSTDAFRPGAGVLPDQLRASDMMEVDAKLSSRSLRKQVLSGSLRAVKKNPVLNNTASLFGEAISRDRKNLRFRARCPTGVLHLHLRDVGPVRDCLRDGWLALLTTSRHRRSCRPRPQSEQYPNPQAEHQNQGAKRVHAIPGPDCFRVVLQRPHVRPLQHRKYSHQHKCPRDQQGPSDVRAREHKQNADS